MEYPSDIYWKLQRELFRKKKELEDLTELARIRNYKVGVAENYKGDVVDVDLSITDIDKYSVLLKQLTVSTRGVGTTRIDKSDIKQIGKEFLKIIKNLTHDPAIDASEILSYDKIFAIEDVGYTVRMGCHPTGGFFINMMYRNPEAMTYGDLEHIVVRSIRLLGDYSRPIPKKTLGDPISGLMAFE